MNIITCLIWNMPYNISEMIFIHMLDNIKGEKFLQYPRFVQMLLDDQIANLPKEEDDELVLHHMDNETLRRLNVYRGQPTEPPSRKKFAAITKSDYEAPADDNNDLGTETEKMSLFEPKRSRWWVKVDDKKQKKMRTPTQKTPKASTPKAAAKRTPKKKKTPMTPHLVDEPSGMKLSMVVIMLQNAEKAGGEKAVGENVETVDETLVEGVVCTDSNETKSDIDLTQIAPTTCHNEKRGRKKGQSRKRKNSDDEDASYVPSAVEKITKGIGRLKRSSQLAEDIPRKHKIRKTTAKVVKATSGKSMQVPVESVVVEVPIFQSEVHIATPTTSPRQESIHV
ncbi:hypothetical protein Hdeb2414_s0005g00153611 [Helianthus debilis subsp. tardiflorus]